MGTIHLTADIDAPAAEVWDRVSKLDAAAELTNMIAAVEVLGDDERVCSTADGGRIVERIISTDDDAMRQAYTVVEGPFGHEHHNASLQVFDNGDTSRLAWITDLLPDALAEHIHVTLEAEFATLVERVV